LIAKTAGSALVLSNKNSRMVSGLIELFGHFKRLSGAYKNAKAAAFAFILIDNHSLVHDMEIVTL
jgi:hypothetical protein